MGLNKICPTLLTHEVYLTTPHMDTLALTKNTNLNSGEGQKKIKQKSVSTKSNLSLFRNKITRTEMGGKVSGGYGVCD